MNGNTAQSVALLCIGLATLWMPRSPDAQTADTGNIILGRPTDDSITVHVLAAQETELFAEYGDSPGIYSGRTSVVVPSVDGVAEIEVGGLEGDTRYFYRVGYRGPDDSDYRAGDEHSFHTRRSKGSTFTFGVQGDSHPERRNIMYHPDLYVRTMEQVASARPDLYFMLGDDFSISNPMADFYQGNDEALNQRIVDDVYLNQRRFLGLMASSTALFAVNGNHEEARRHFLGTPLHDVSIFAGRARTRFLPLPAPNDFYTGNPEPVEWHRSAEGLFRLRVGRCALRDDRPLLAFAGAGRQLRRDECGTQR